MKFKQSSIGHRFVLYLLIVAVLDLIGTLVLIAVFGFFGAIFACCYVPAADLFLFGLLFLFELCYQRADSTARLRASQKYNAIKSVLELSQ